MTDRQSESYKKVLLLGTGIFLFLWLLLMFAGRSNLLRDPGTFSHLVIGERILSTGHFIYNDPFSFTFSGKPWIAQQWLGECLMAVIHRIGGFDSLLLFTVTLLASLYTWLILRLMRKGMHPMLAILIIAMAMAASSFHFHVRPHLVTIIFSAVLFAVLTDFESGQIRLSRLFWLIPLFALWVNIHGGVLGGMATLAITGTGWILIRLVKKSPPLLTFQQIFSLLLLILACLSTAFVNPYGLALPKTWFLIMNSPLLPQVIQEHAPLFSSGSFYAVLPFALLYFICLLGTLPGWPRITWLIPAVWFCLALMRVRHAPLFAVFAAIAIGDMFPHVRWVKWLSDRGSEIVKIQNTTYFQSPQKIKQEFNFYSHTAYDHWLYLPEGRLAHSAFGERLGKTGFQALANRGFTRIAANPAGQSGRHTQFLMNSCLGVFSCIIPQGYGYLLMTDANSMEMIL